MAGAVWLFVVDDAPSPDDRPGIRLETKPDPPPPPEPEGTFDPPPCPADLTNCASALGRIIYVEKVDPDGDGDAHFVTVSSDGVTAPGVTIFDVREDLRPDPLPGVGDIVGGAGPVYRGSRGQKQIEVVEFEVAE